MCLHAHQGHATCFVLVIRKSLTAAVGVLGSYVFPSATHTRFEHSIGVAHKAQELAFQIWQGQGKELGMTMSDVHTVELAGAAAILSQPD